MSLKTKCISAAIIGMMVLSLRLHYQRSHLEEKTALTNQKEPSLQTTNKRPLPEPHPLRLQSIEEKTWRPSPNFDPHDGASREAFRQSILAAMMIAPQATLEALAQETDPDTLYLMVEAVSLHYSDQPIIHALDKLEFLRSTRFELHEPIVVELLKTRSHSAAPQEIVHYLQQPENHLFGLMAGQEAGAQLMKYDPQNRLTYLQSIQSPALRNELIKGASVAWMRHAPEAALDFVLANNQNARFDKAIQRYVIDHAYKNPSFTSELALSLTDEQTRGTLLSDSGQAFYNMDRSAYHHWLNRQTPEIQTFLRHEENTHWQTNETDFAQEPTVEDRQAIYEQDIQNVHKADQNSASE